MKPSEQAGAQCKDRDLQKRQVVGDREIMGMAAKNGAEPKNARLTMSADAAARLVANSASSENSRSTISKPEEETGDRRVERRCDTAGGTAGNDDPEPALGYLDHLAQRRCQR